MINIPTPDEISNKLTSSQKREFEKVLEIFVHALSEYDGSPIRFSNFLFDSKVAKKIKQAFLLKGWSISLSVVNDQRDGDFFDVIITKLK